MALKILLTIFMLGNLVIWPAVILEPRYGYSQATQEKLGFIVIAVILCAFAAVLLFIWG